eukprot:2748394-Rhodomonas_salina.1
MSARLLCPVYAISVMLVAMPSPLRPYGHLRYAPTAMSSTDGACVVLVGAKALEEGTATSLIGSFVYLTVPSPPPAFLLYLSY